MSWWKSPKKMFTKSVPQQLNALYKPTKIVVSFEVPSVVYTNVEVKDWCRNALHIIRDDQMIALRCEDITNFRIVSHGSRDLECVRNLLRCIAELFRGQAYPPELNFSSWNESLMDIPYVCQMISKDGEPTVRIRYVSLHDLVDEFDELQRLYKTYRQRRDDEEDRKAEARRALVRERQANYEKILANRKSLEGFSVEVGDTVKSLKNDTLYVVTHVTSRLMAFGHKKGTAKEGQWLDLTMFELNQGETQ